jgi:glycosyltransferase involved in cell wall biosynthesis
MLAQDFDGELEFLFIDGRSDDRSRELLQRFATQDSRIHIFDNPARRTAAGLNVGLRAARGRWVVRMDAHTVYPGDYIRLGVERLKQGDADWVTGPQVPVGDGPWSRRVALALGSWIGQGQSGKWSGAERSEPAPREFELATSVFTGVWARSTLDALGGWDEGWPVNQDSELAARLRRSGGRIVCRTDMGAAYVPRDSLRRLGQQYGRFGYYRAKTFLRHPDSLPKSRWLPVGALACIIAATMPQRHARRIGLAGSGCYFAGLAAISLRARRRAGRESYWLVPIFITMHLSWAFGFLLGLSRHLPHRRSLGVGPAPLQRPAGSAPEPTDALSVPSGSYDDCA